MIEYIVEKICDNDDEKKIIHFGLERFKIVVISLALIIITGSLLNETIRSIMFVVCILPLRQNAGGYHMKNSQTCAVFSYILFLLLILCIKFLDADYRICVLTWIGCFVLILLLAPIGTENHQLDMAEKKVYGRRSRFICCIESALFLILVYFRKAYWYKVILFAEIIETVLLVIGKIQESKRERESTYDI